MKKSVFILAFILVLLFSVSCAGGNKIVSPLFKITANDMQALVSDLPESIGEGILKTPAPFLELCYQVLQQPVELTWLVDKKHALPEDYAPADLANLRDYPVKITKDGLLVRRLILGEYLGMVKAAAAGGIVLRAASTYRSFGDQLRLFDYWVRQLGLAQAEIESAHAGMSQHQLGTTIDFDPITDAFGKAPAYAWLTAHAREYGFALSYPEGGQDVTGYIYEPWHWRYVGKPAAELCHSYFEGVQQYFLEFWDANGEWIRERMRIA